MTHVVGNLVIVEPERKQQCDECGKVAELRPYGKNGACICFQCAMKDENETKKNFAKVLGDA